MGRAEGQVRYGSMCQSSTSLCPLSASTPEASVWPSPRQMPGPSPSPWDADQPAATTRHSVGPFSSSTHEALIPKRIWWAGLVSGKRATYPYSCSWRPQTMQIANLIWVSLSNRSLDTKSDQWQPRILQRDLVPKELNLSQIPGHCPTLTSVEQNWKHQGV